MASERALGKAKTEKNDEFYTQLADIEKEMRYYKDFFRGKTVLCNCDDPFESDFFKYFALNFNSLGLRKLIATCYAESQVMYTQLAFFNSKVEGIEQVNKKPYKIEISEITDENNDGRVDLTDVEYLLLNRKNLLTMLEGDGDFRSEECIALLDRKSVV